jgi:hypothetical protein
LVQALLDTAEVPHISIYRYPYVLRRKRRAGYPSCFRAPGGFASAVVLVHRAGCCWPQAGLLARVAYLASTNWNQQPRNPAPALSLLQERRGAEGDLTTNPTIEKRRRGGGLIVKCGFNAGEGFDDVQFFRRLGKNFLWPDERANKQTELQLALLLTSCSFVS